ncbi:MAG: hypothetical protein IT366_21360 [Candidatus Hydrogenedentes bacterium]|nr:hypothetical protein [Candidatus Hydrogenedentota bacterium]
MSNDEKREQARVLRVDVVESINESYGEKDYTDECKMEVAAALAGAAALLREAEADSAPSAGRRWGVNLNPTSPFSGKPLNQCDERELDAWTEVLINKNYPEVHMWIRNRGAARHFGSQWEDAGPLMERKEWPMNLELTRCSGGFGVYEREWLSSDESEVTLITQTVFAPAAIRNAFIIAYVSQQQRNKKAM